MFVPFLQFAYVHMALNTDVNPAEELETSEQVIRLIEQATDLGNLP
jgi:hypothetical protein